LKSSNNCIVEKQLINFSYIIWKNDAFRIKSTVKEDIIVVFVSAKMVVGATASPEKLLILRGLKFRGVFPYPVVV